MLKRRLGSRGAPAASFGRCKETHKGNGWMELKERRKRTLRSTSGPEVKWKTCFKGGVVNMFRQETELETCRKSWESHLWAWVAWPSDLTKVSGLEVTSVFLYHTACCYRRVHLNFLQPHSLSHRLPFLSGMLYPRVQAHLMTFGTRLSCCARMGTPALGMHNTNAIPLYCRVNGTPNLNYDLWKLSELGSFLWDLFWW